MGVLRRLAILALAVAALAGCGPAASPSGGSASSGSPSPATASISPSALPGPVTVSRSGGIAGVNDTLTIAPDGGWTFRDRTGKTQNGHLSEAQRAELAALLADPTVGREARQAPGNPPCMDAFVYQLSAGSLLVRGPDCGDLSRVYPGLARVVSLLADVTPL